MTEGQWTWMAVHYSIDNDIEYDRTCHSCKEDIKIPKCNVCRKELETANSDFNPNFSDEMFEKLKNFSNMGRGEE